MPLEIVKENRFGDKESEIHRHPAFGLIRFSRMSGGSKDFFGSDLKQENYIQLEVVQAELNKTLTKEWFGENYSNKNRNVIRLKMTSNQFSELITSLNMGSGVPCTLECINGEEVEQIYRKENRKEFVHRSFEERMEDFASRFNSQESEVKELIEKKSLSKEDRNKLKFLFDSIKTEITSNIPFFMKCFQETSDKIVTEAKQEIENSILHKITSMGLESLKNSLLEKNQEVKQIE